MQKWKFEKKHRGQKSRDPMQASFFTNASIDDDTQALVREAIQNSLDAKYVHESCEPVRVRFNIAQHNTSNRVMERYLSDEAWLHFNAEDNGLTTPPTSSNNCRYLVYEDFNTKGLVGNELASEAELGNSFYYFMRAEGQSGKEDGERGRHGIGKFVFPYTSGIRMFIAATVRSSDKRCLIAGQSVLKFHHVNDEQYTPDGWWGEFEDDGFQLPIEDSALFEQLRNDFQLARTLTETGLSLIMPYIRDEVTADILSEHAIREYFWPILQGQLTVEIVENGEHRVIDMNSITTKLDELIPQKNVGKISPFIKLANQVFGEANLPNIELNIPTSPASPVWNESYLTKEIASTINEKLSIPDIVIRIKCPLFVRRKGTKTASISHFDIYISKEVSDSSQKPLFIREGITIPEDRVPKVRGYTSIVVIEAGKLATLLGDSENPAHTEWEKNATKFKGKYNWGYRTIDFVRLSVTKLLKLLSQGDSDEDVTVLSDIFYLDLPENKEEVPESRKKNVMKKPSSKNPMPPPIPHQRKPRTYRLIKRQNGFVLSGPKEPLAAPRKYKVTVAYDFAGASKKSALKKYHKNDFDLSKGKNVDIPISEKVDDFEISSNKISFTASDNEFEVVVTGFDYRRDIIVDINSEVSTDEEV